MSKVKLTYSDGNNEIFEVDAPNQRDAVLIAKRYASQEHPEKELIGATFVCHVPGTAPDTSLHLGDVRRAWLQEQGGIQPTIMRLIDDAMKS